MKLWNESVRAEELWTIAGSFGYVNGLVKKKENYYVTENETYSVTAGYTEKQDGIIVRNDVFSNVSDHSVVVSHLSSRFIFSAGEYEVYTQRNSWQNESTGGWQPLITAVCAETSGVRNAYGAAPFFAIWNRQTGRGMAFHIMTKLPWYYEVRNVPAWGEVLNLEIEIGINPFHLAVGLDAGESMELPEIICYEFRNKLDMDCHKLHHYVNNRYPRRELPVIYNTWLYKFEKINFENVVSQIPAAKELGVEYFVIDAGWFGHGAAAGFWECRGDWFENQEDGFCGRMEEISALVRENGMKFGFWLEIETAGRNSKMLKLHRDYYITYDHHGQELYFFDFANQAACDDMLSVIGGLIEKYHADFIKFDFNQDMSVDVRQKAFTDYFEGYQHFINRLRENYPHLYMENCASGGNRMSLVNGLDFDSFWLSDNQSAYEGMRIFKDTIRRMPPQMIEKWATIQSIYGFKHCYGDNPDEKLITTNDATWFDVRGIHQSYLEGFLTGSPICFSCDLNGLSENVLAGLKALIAEFKENREFWKNAVCRILADTESVLVLEYSDVDFETVEVVIYTNRIWQSSLKVYPAVSLTARYSLGGLGAEREIISGAQLDCEGIEIPLEGNFISKKLKLEMVR